MSFAAKQYSALSQFEQIRLAAHVVKHEANALLRMEKNIPIDLPRAAELLASCRGSIVVSGIGKAGWIGQKISATLSSTGSRSHFLHPSEAVHGDLGKIGRDDVVLALSNSGETIEMIQILPSINRMNVPIVSITSHPNSTLAKQSQIVLEYGNSEEACPLGLAPTTTTTMMLALGDALAMVTSRLRDLQPQDFARCHPGGNLGKQLSTVDEVMRPISECRVANQDATVREIYIQLGGPKRRSGAVILTSDQDQLAGIFTDSDLARLLEKQKDELFDRPIREVMTVDPAKIFTGSKTLVAVELLASLNISELPIVDANDRPVGLIDITDLIGLFPLERQSA